MPTTFQTCGVPYTQYEDGRISVNGEFPVYTDPSIQTRLAKLWERFGPTFVAAGREKGVVPIWLAAVAYIETGGNPTALSPCEPKYCSLYPKCLNDNPPACAGGLMQFIAQTAAGFGKTIGHYLNDPDDQIHDAATIFQRKLAKNGGDMLTAVKRYNGGVNPCPGGGITGHGGQADYVTKFVRAANTLHQMGVSQSAGLSGGVPFATGLLAGAVMGLATYYLATQTSQGRRAVASVLRRISP